jgi:heavy metal sensor kinase
MIRFQPRNVRMRLTLWYLAVLGGILVLFAVGTSAFLFLHLRETLDEAVADDVESVEAQLSFHPDGTLSVGTDGARKQDPDAQQDRYLEIRSPDGSLLYRNDRLQDQGLGGAPGPGEGKDGYSQHSIHLQNGPRLRVASRLHTIGTRRVLIRLGHSEEPLWREFKELLWVLFLGLPIALSLAGLGGYALARRVLAPIDRITRRAEQITAERLGERLPVDNPEDEIGHLARVFNDTLMRLERSFEQLRRFTADASHELRTPLTAIQSVGEVGLQGTRSVSYYRDIIGSMLEEVNRLTRLVDTLLTISRADSGQLQLQRTNLSLLNVARESAGLLEVLAEEKQQQLIVQGDERAVVSGDRIILRQALMNLVDNAIKYSPAGETVLVGVARDKGNSVIEVTDHGPGIPLEHQAKVFERFYRVDKARSQQSGGAGLGLSIVRWAVEAHGGKIELFTEEGKGSTFRMTFPAVPVEHLVAA